MESAEVHVERGTEQLQRAAYYQVSSGGLLVLMGVSVLATLEMGPSSALYL